MGQSAWDSTRLGGKKEKKGSGGAPAEQKRLARFAIEFIGGKSQKGMGHSDWCFKLRGRDAKCVRKKWAQGEGVR